MTWLARDPLKNVIDRIGSTMDACSAGVREATRAVMQEARRVSREELTRTAQLVPGRDRTFSRMGATLGVRIRSAPGEVNVIPKGPWGIAEQGAAPHEMQAWGRGSVDHPGTRSSQGRQSWSRGRDAAFETLGITIPEIYEQTVTESFEGG